jgi:hypothetical protein
MAGAEALLYRTKICCARLRKADSSADKPGFGMTSLEVFSLATRSARLSFLDLWLGLCRDLLLRT